MAEHTDHRVEERQMSYGGTPEERRKKAYAATRKYRSTPKGLVTNRMAAARWQREWRATEDGRATRRRRYAENVNHRLGCVLRCRVYQALKGHNKSASTMELIGCTVEQARTHIESTCLPGWTWENYGVLWEIDHRKPCAKFDLSDPVAQRECFHWSNLRAYPPQANKSEGARR